MSQNFRILLVEDDDSLRECLGEFLAELGWGVAATAFATEAVAIAHRQRFDFALLDFHLPETTGPQLLQQLRTIRPLPSILMSGLANAADVAAAQQSGFFSFLRKPLDLRVLRQTLESLIAAHFGGPLAPPLPLPPSARARLPQRLPRQGPQQGTQRPPPRRDR
ncbi:MAG: response regulator [Planctomycetota bacterium]